MIISPSRNFIFIHLEKCGGTSVETALQPYLHWSDIILGSTEFGESYQQLLHNRYGVEEVRQRMLWKHSTAKDIYEFVTPEGWKDFRKIYVVRKPTEMLRSLYFFSSTAVKYHIGRVNRETWKEMLATQSFPEQWPYTEKYVQAYSQSEIDGSGINGFISNILNSGGSFIAPQVERIKAFPSDRIDFIVDLSDLGHRWEEMLGVIGIEDSVALNQLNVSKKAAGFELSDKSIKLIKKHFAVDYDIIPGYTGVNW